MKFSQLQEQRGAIAIITILWVMVFSLAVLTTTSALSVGELQMVGGEASAEKVFHAAEARLNNAIYQMIVSGSQYNESDYDFDGIRVDVTTTTDPGNPFRWIVNSKAFDLSSTSTRTLEVAVNTSSFGGINGAVLASTGGLVIDNNATVNGDVYTNYNIDGGNRNNTTINGETTVAGANSTSDVTINGNLRSHTISSSIVNGDAYYQTISGTTVNGNSYSGSPDPAPIVFPPERLHDFIMTSVHDRANAGMQFGCPGNTGLTINAPQTLGPAWICGDLKIALLSDEELTLTGAVWVTGKIEVEHPNAILQIDDSYGPNSEAIVAETGVFNMKNNLNIFGACQTPGCVPQVSPSNTNPFSFVVVTSLADTDDAVTVRNNGNGAIFYAPFGELELVNGVALKNATGETVHLNNTVRVTYDPNLQFVTLRGGGSKVIIPGPGTWKEK